MPALPADANGGPGAGRVARPPRRTPGPNGLARRLRDGCVHTMPSAALGTPKSHGVRRRAPSQPPKLHGARLAGVLTVYDGFVYSMRRSGLHKRLPHGKGACFQPTHFCVSEFNTNELQTEKKERAKQDLVAKIEDLEMTVNSQRRSIS